MGWVGQLAGLSWSQSPEGLADVLQDLAEQPALRHLSSLAGAGALHEIVCSWGVAAALAKVGQFGVNR